MNPATSGPTAPILIIGAGPAGLTAAHQLARRGISDVVIVEADDTVGGISRTVERDGFRFDIGGHRFFTKVPAVEALWHEILPPGAMLTRPRKSRIFYAGRFYDYPLKPANALANLGPVEAARCAASYLWARIRPPRDTSTFEGWTAARFGWRLYRTFFKTYTEKVWGVPATAIQADWAAQRIKNLSLGRAVWSSLAPKSRRGGVTSLIEEFEYPALGPGMMWEACRDEVVAAGHRLHMEAPVEVIRRSANGATAVVTNRRGVTTVTPCSHVISSMPLGHVVACMDPPPPEDVLKAAGALRHRDFLTVALVVPAGTAFPDNWLYIHEPGVRVGRVQNFGAWSPHLVRDGYTCLGMEYFVNQGDDLWEMADEDLVAMATAELDRLKLAHAADVDAGYVVRMPMAYPVYDSTYAANVDIVRRWLEHAVPNVHPVGRNGMHRYNNQDHSMVTAMLTVENLVDGADHDVWSVNVEEDYHEELRPRGGTGRDAPIVAAAS